MKKGFISEIVGGIGIVIILISYALLNFGIITGPSFAYQSMVFAGSCLIIYNAFVKKTNQLVVLNIIWAIAALVVIVRGILL